MAGESTLDAVPDWEMIFRFEGGLLPLALTATVGERWRLGFERLPTSQEWGQWLVESGMVSAMPVLTDGDVAEARSLREAIYRSVQARRTGETMASDDAAVINLWAGRPGRKLALTGSAERVVLAAPDQSARCLADLARQTIEMLADAGVIARIRECAASDCALLFYDASRPGQRRWCSDGGCGTRNRARQRRAMPQG